MLTIRPLFSLIRSVGAFQSNNGNVAIMFAVMLPLVVGGAGFGVETTYWYLTRLNMQAAADAAAHAGAMDMRTGSSVAAVTATSTQTAAANGFDTATGTIEVNTPPKTGSGGPDAVEVILKLQATRLFTAVFFDGGVDMQARAVAKFSNAGNACVLALNPSASKAALFSGSSDLKLTGCSVMANSVASDALTSQGSAKVAAQCLISGGGVSLNGGVTMTCGSAVTNASPVADPFRNLVVPTDASACRNDNGANLSPGNYCSGMNLKNNVTLAPGVYIVSGGDFKVNAGANINGAGVTIYLAAGSHLSLNGNADVNLSAPTSGAYSGILIFGDRNGGGKNIVNGSATSKMTGAIYFKSQEVDYLGNFSGQNGCTQVVADQIQWSGNTSVSADCTSLGMSSIPALMIVKLTE